MASFEDRLPKMHLPGDVVDRSLDVEDGEISVTLVYDDGLSVTFWVRDEQVVWEANRPWRTRDDGVIVFMASEAEH